MPLPAFITARIERHRRKKIIRPADYLRIETCAMTAFYMSCNALLFIFMNAIQPDPYMDEIFHIPQAQQYCNGTFHKWNPKITTLPGLYLMSCMLIGWNTKCTVFNLRMVNFIFALANLWVIYRLTRKISGFSVSAACFTAFTIVHFPLLHFFTFLYYTDVGSTFFILLTYHLSLHEYHLVGAFTGYIAVLFRQSNIVWVFFTATVSISDKVFALIGDLLQKDIPSDQFFSTVGFTLKHFTTAFAKDVRKTHKLKKGAIEAGKQTVLDLLKELFGRLWGYAIIGVIFIIFCIWNRGIVVGDRDAHAMVLNIPQMFYFVSFCIFFSAPHVWNRTNIRSAMIVIRKHYRNILIIVVLANLSVRFFSHVHPYLLADNRHYSFYIWRLFNYHYIIKYSATPIYVISFLIMNRVLSHMHIGWRGIYFFCCFITLVPQKLLEFRYFIVPYIIFRLHLINPGFKSTMSELTNYAVIDAITILLFAYKPYHWEDSEDTQRFMW